MENTFNKVVQINRLNIINKNLVIESLGYILYLILILIFVTFGYKFNIINLLTSAIIICIATIIIMYKILDLYMKKQDNILTKIKKFFVDIGDAILPSYITKCKQQN